MSTKTKRVPIKQRLDESYQRGFADGRESMRVYTEQTREDAAHRQKLALIDARTRAINASGQAMDAVQKALHTTLSTHL